MLKDITLGQYFPGNSILHRLDPRAKILISLFYIVAVFLAQSSLSYLLLLVSIVAIVLISKIPFKIIFKGIKPVLFIMAFTAFINLFLTKGDRLLFQWWVIRIYLEGIVHAIYMIVRILSLVVSVSVFLTYTTSPIALTDAIERLLGPLKKIKLPVHEFAMMMTIALRFIPTLIEETDKIMSAQKARGSDFGSGGLIKKAKSLVPVLIPLFVSAFRRADELAVAMECRCYRGGNSRTRMVVLHYVPKDIVWLLLFVFFNVAIVLLNIYFPGFML